MQRLRVRVRELAGAGAFYLAAAVLFTWPLALRMRSGMPDLWDDKLNAWIFHWDFHQIFRDPLRLFDANIFHPARYTLAFSENLFGAAIFGFPLYAAGASTLLTANVLMLLGMALSGFAAWALARDVTGDRAASLVAGLVYAFVPWRIAQLPHVQFQWGAFLALLTLFLLRAFAAGRRRDAALFGLFFAWNALTNVHYALFSALLTAVVVAYAALTLEWPVFLRRAGAVAAAGAIACLVAAPFYVPYARASRMYGMVRGEAEIESYSGRPVDFLTAGPQNKLYAPLTQKWGHGEGDFFPGLTAIVLGVIGWRRLRRAPDEPAVAPGISPRRRLAARVLDAAIVTGLAAAAVAVLLRRETLGPIKVRDPGRILVIAVALLLVRLVLAFPRRSRFASLSDFVRRSRADSRAVLFTWIAILGILVALGVRTPFYRFLVQSLGSVFRSIRVPGRGIVLFDLALGVLAAWGLSLATSRRTKGARRAIVLGVLLLVTFEYRAFPIDIGPVPESPPAVYRWLSTASLPGGGAIVEWPLGFDYDAEHVFRSTAHWKPLVNGYSGFAPPHYDRLHDLLGRTPIPDDVWAAMRALDGSILVFHPDETPDEAIRRYSDILRRGLREGRISPLATFPRSDEETPDLVFRIGGTPGASPAVPPPSALPAPDAAIALIDRAEGRRTAPFGSVDGPAEGAEVAPGYWAFGWALDDSGIARVTMSAEGSTPLDCVIHAPFPGIDSLFGRYPDAKAPGFLCPVPKVPPGRHVLVIDFVARDGGTTRTRRTFRIRG